jgi:hypothetical protein
LEENPMTKFATLIAGLCCSTGILACQALANSKPIANAGTLTCALSPAEKSRSENASLTSVSCRFNALVGPGADFEGQLSRKPVTSERDAKVVLVWSVVAPQPDVALEDLEGQYVGQIARPGRDATAGGLRGGRDGSIALRPFNPDPAVIPPAGIAKLSLKLVEMKT